MWKQVRRTALQSITSRAGLTLATLALASISCGGREGDAPVMTGAGGNSGTQGGASGSTQGGSGTGGHGTAGSSSVGTTMGGSSMSSSVSTTTGPVQCADGG